MAQRSWARQGSEQLTPWQVVFAENLPGGMESRLISIQQFQEADVTRKRYLAAHGERSQCYTR
jgi:hypothetical protein